MNHLMAIDPGRSKCGLAVADENGDILVSKVISCRKLPDELALIKELYAPEVVLLGNGTASSSVARILSRLGYGSSICVDETGSTLEARRKYFEINPPQGWRRLIPISFLLTPVDYDDYVARILIERYLSK
ncbi:MAG: hypothetical protein WC074_06385 [bacterium]